MSHHELQGFDDRTVVIAGAGCEIGAGLAHAFARGGARVIVVDRDEPAALRIARTDPARIETLQLDAMHAHLCQRLGELWEAEPLHVLIHLQALRHPDLPATVMRSVEALTMALAGGLEAGQGRVVMICAAGPVGGDTAAALLQRAADRLPAALQAALAGRGVCVNGVRLARGPADLADLCAAVGFLARPGGLAIGGALLPLLRRSD